jgi:hypothetical protein
LYGPDTARATKLVAALFTRPSRRDADAMESWTLEAGDVRNDPVVAAHLAAWLKSHGVKDTITTDRIIGCPHQEGIDYPMGRACPQCPLWADIDRFTHERLAPPVATMSPEVVIAELSQHHPTPPVEALESADAHREALTQPLLDAIEGCLARGDHASDEQAQLLSHALYLLAKWREPRACPLVVRWLSMPEEVTEILTGDILTEDGARILAAVYDGNLPAIRTLVLDRDADEFSRAVAIGGLALLAAWNEVPPANIVEELLLLARERLEREPSYVWGALASRCVDIEAIEVLPELRRARDEGLINPSDIDWSEVEEMGRSSTGVLVAETREREPPIDDVAEATAWWGDYYLAGGERVVSDGSEPYRAPPKIGRNDPCPCGSGKKYKKCCAG